MFILLLNQNPQNYSWKGILCLTLAILAAIVWTRAMNNSHYEEMERRSRDV